jgi:acyl dehydratase
METVATGLSLLYAEGSGDRFPIHTDANFAKSVGLPDVIVHGMCTLAIATRAVVESVAEGDSARLKSVSVRFAKMVFHEDALTTRIWNGDDGQFAFETLNQRGEAVLIEGACTFG